MPQHRFVKQLLGAPRIVPPPFSANSGFPGVQHHRHRMPRWERDRDTLIVELLNNTNIQTTSVYYLPGIVLSSFCTSTHSYSSPPIYLFTYSFSLTMYHRGLVNSANHCIPKCIKSPIPERHIHNSLVRCICMGAKCQERSLTVRRYHKSSTVSLPLGSNQTFLQMSSFHRKKTQHS